jgi:hypothetical protein
MIKSAEGLSSERAEGLDDLRLAVRLLEGYHDQKDGLPEKRYIDDDKELVSRKALVRLLRSPEPLNSKLRWLLAALFDPEAEEPPYISFDSAPIERRLAIIGRYRGARMQSLRQIEMAVAFDELRHAEGKNREEALNEIAERYDVSVRSVEAANAHLESVIKE